MISRLDGIYLLLSDAIAFWYLHAHKNDPTLAAEFEEALAASANEDEMLDLVKRQRECKALRNDDVAAIRLEVTFAAKGT